MVPSISRLFNRAGDCLQLLLSPTRPSFEDVSSSSEHCNPDQIALAHTSSAIRLRHHRTLNGRDRIFLVIDVETGELLDLFEAASNYWLTTNADRLPILRNGRIELRGLPE